MKKINGEITKEGLPKEFVELIGEFHKVAIDNRHQTGREPVFLLEHIETIIRRTARKVS